MEEPRIIQAIREKGGRVELVDSFDAGDGLIWSVYAVVDERGRPRILLIKSAPNGYTKKVVQVTATDAERVAGALMKAREKLREML